MDWPLEQVPWRSNASRPGGKLLRRGEIPSTPRLFPATERDFKEGKAIDHTRKFFIKQGIESSKSRPSQHNVNPLDLTHKQYCAITVQGVCTQCNV